ncbi:uncharacterized protein LACBIDRAFT_330276 [Laccaria bicolor S238N-H82]|uniref:Predicted protein n=1 Tax=Laccaria bicolor (strain S238N-H82 / ATCC MYA-4686) TaxID=486041 RepID=B0DKS2_LACBS|nr:uncharacterized protein LACBIDRAFT_330276 [Laccaria bicolor S238N-H82]EDR04790.1 predicted protein [Laccaria bicolor S238N-H82]|eukprot:XP_001884614.1 predicted protein [Laccaria bicolor S238N-H82]
MTTAASFWISVAFEGSYDISDSGVNFTQIGTDLMHNQVNEAPFHTRQTPSADIDHFCDAAHHPPLSRNKRVFSAHQCTYWTLSLSDFVGGRYCSRFNIASLQMSVTDTSAKCLRTWIKCNETLIWGANASHSVKRAIHLGTIAVELLVPFSSFGHPRYGFDTGVNTRGFRDLNSGPGVGIPALQSSTHQ